MLAQEVIVHTLTGDVTPLTYQSGAAQAMSVTVSGTITGDGNAAVVVTSVELAGGSQTVNVAVDDGVNQVETATVIGTITGDGNAAVIVTAAGMTGSPKTINVAVVAPDNASAVGGKIRTALGADSDVTALFGVSGSGANVVLTRSAKVANDATLNISIDNGTCTGLTAAPTSTNTTAGAVPDTAATVAGKIRTALNGVTAITDVFTVGGSSANVTLTRNAADDNDSTMRIQVGNGTCTGLTTTYSTVTTLGVAAGATGIFTRHFVIRSDADNSGIMYIGHSDSNNEYPATLDATNALHILEPGDSVAIHESPLSQSHGEEYILSHWCVDGTASDICRVTYVKRRNSAAAS